MVCSWEQEQIRLNKLMIEFLEEDNEESDIEFDDEEESGEEDNLERQDLDSDTEQGSFGFR